MLHLEIRGVEKLSLRERQVVAHKESGVGNEEVAKRLGLSPTSVATLYRRARAKGYQVVMIIPGEALGLVDGPEEPAGEGE